MEHAKLLEELHGEIDHLIGMLPVAVEKLRQRVQREAEHVRNRLVDGERNGVIEHQPGAHAGCADDDIAQIHVFFEGVDRRERTGKDIRPPRRNAADLLLFIQIQALQQIVRMREIHVVHHVIVDHADGILSHDLGDAADIAERAAHADQLSLGIDRLQPGNLRELFGKEFLHFLRLLLGGEPVVREQLGQRDGAERQRLVRQKIPAVVVDDLRAAAADFQNDPLGNVHRVDDALIDVHRLFLGGENAELDAAGRRDLIQKTSLIFRMANRRGRDRDDLFDAV